MKRCLKLSARKCFLWLLNGCSRLDKWRQISLRIHTNLVVGLRRQETRQQQTAKILAPVKSMEMSTQPKSNHNSSSTASDPLISSVTLESSPILLDEFMCQALLSLIFETRPHARRCVGQVQ